MTIVSVALGRKERIWERRLLHDFRVVSVAGDADIGDAVGANKSQSRSRSDLEVGQDASDPTDRFRRLAMMVISSNNCNPNAKDGGGHSTKSL